MSTTAMTLFGLIALSLVFFTLLPARFLESSTTSTAEMSLTTDPAIDHVSSLLAELDNVHVIKVRGNLLFNENALNEGPIGKTKDSIVAYFNFPSEYRTPQWIIGYAPYVKQHQCPGTTRTVELIHHMNVLTKTKDDNSDDDNYDSDDDRARFLATYDRGAHSFAFQQTTDQQFKYGIPLGDQPLILEYHLLKPPCWQWEVATHITDDSGFDLYITNKPPVSNAAIVGFMDQNMEILPQHGFAEQVSLSKDISTIFLPNVVDEWPSNVPSIELIGIHIHTHDIFQFKYFTITDKDGNEKFKSKVETTGYGAIEQSMIRIEMELFPGDELQQHCLVDTDTLLEKVVDGTSHGKSVTSEQEIYKSKLKTH